MGKIVIGYLAIGCVFQLLRVIKDIIIERKFGMTNGLECFGTLANIAALLLEIFIWPIEIVLLVMMFTNHTPKWIVNSFEILQQNKEQNKDEEQ